MGLAHNSRKQSRRAESTLSRGPALTRSSPMRPALLLLLLAQPAFAAWTITPYDPAPNGGWSPSLRIGPGPIVDGTGFPNIAYWSPGSGFHYYDGVTSQSANPPFSPGAPPDQVQLIQYGEAALALDNGGQPWIAEANLD